MVITKNAGLTREQAEELEDAVILCRSTSRKLMLAEGEAQTREAMMADDAARDAVMALIKEATNEA